MILQWVCRRIIIHITVRRIKNTHSIKVTVILKSTHVMEETMSFKWKKPKSELYKWKFIIWPIRIYIHKQIWDKVNQKYHKTPEILYMYMYLKSWAEKQNHIATFAIRFTYTILPSVQILQSLCQNHKMIIFNSRKCSI